MKNNGTIRARSLLFARRVFQSHKMLKNSGAVKGVTGNHDETVPNPCFAPEIMLKPVVTQFRDTEKPLLKWIHS